jgi:hypothetical protein
VSQKIHHLLWNPKVRYRIHKNPPLVPALTQMSEVCVVIVSSFKISLNVHRLHVGETLIEKQSHLEPRSLDALDQRLKQYLLRVSSAVPHSEIKTCYSEIFVIFLSSSIHNHATALTSTLHNISHNH